ncbi:MAG TPA: exosortase A, partial [Rhizomicrobium sp.]|nr:exosortase A [Rhizomicrobium sp.]
VVSEFALVVMAQAIVIAILGVRTARALLFPLAYLLFLVPVGDALIPPLQSLTANFAVALLKLSGIPVHSNGLVIFLPTMTWVVAEACAGVKFLIASVALGALLSEMFLRSWRRRIVFMTLSVAVPIIANGLRAYAIVVIGYLSGNQYAVDADHLLYGWVLFALVLAGMIAIAVAMREPSGQESSPAQAPSPVHPRRIAVSAVPVAALAALLLVLSVRAGTASLEREPAGTMIPATLPLAVGAPWTPVAARDSSPAIFAGADRIWHQAYSDGVTTVHLSVGYFAFERPGAEVASSSHCLAGPHPRVQTGALWQKTGTQRQAFDARALIFGARAQRRLLWHWFWVDGRYTGNPYLAKMLQLKAKLLRAPPAAAVVSVATDFDAARVQEKTAAVALDRFVQHLGDMGARP